MKIVNFSILAYCLWGFATFAHSQSRPPYLTVAIFYVSVDDWADMWLNDVPIVENQHRTGSDKGPQKIEALPQSLCLFNGENVLAIQVDDSTRPVDPNSDYV